MYYRLLRSLLTLMSHELILFQFPPKTQFLSYFLKYNPAINHHLPIVNVIAQIQERWFILVSFTFFHNHFQVISQSLGLLSDSAAMISVASRIQVFSAGLESEGRCPCMGRHRGKGTRQ